MKLHRTLAVAVALALVAPAAPAFAQSTPTREQQQEAATRFKKGLELFKDGDYQAALIEFRRAHELAPNFNVLYNIGQVYFQLQDYANALGALSKYLDDGGGNIPASRRADVTRDVEKLRSRVANVELVCAVPDAEVTIDDVAVGKTPFGKVLVVNVGRHKLVVTKSGFTAATKVIEIASGETMKVLLEPVEQKPATPVAPPPPPAEGPVAPPPAPPEPPAGKPVPVAGIVVSSALAAGAVVTGVLSLTAKTALQDEVKSPTATRDSLDAAKNKLRGFSVATDVLMGSTLIAAGVTLYVGLSGPSKKDAALPAAKRLPELKVGVGPGSLVLHGKF
jgi:hypothetical protein